MWTSIFSFTNSWFESASIGGWASTLCGESVRTWTRENRSSRPLAKGLVGGKAIPGMPLAPGQIYSSNNVALAGLVREAGGIPRDMGVAPDDLDELVARLQACLMCDIVLSTGGVSVGSFDLVKEAYVQLGLEMDFWKVRMKPGKPLAFGCLEISGRSVPFFGLPGNPVSCMVNFLQYVRPWMLRCVGQPRPFLPVISAVAAEAFTQRPGREQLVRVVLEPSEGGWRCRPTGSQSSGVLQSMALAHGFL